MNHLINRTRSIGLQFLYQKQYLKDCYDIMGNVANQSDLHCQRYQTRWHIPQPSAEARTRGRRSVTSWEDRSWIVRRTVALRADLRRLGPALRRRCCDEAGRDDWSCWTRCPAPTRIAHGRLAVARFGRLKAVYIRSPARPVSAKHDHQHAQ